MASIGKSVVDYSSTASREIGRNISFRCAFFFGIYDILLPLVVLVVSNRNLCAQVFFLFSRRLILEKIPIGEWFEG